MTISVPTEPIWSLDRRESSGQLFWRRDASKVKFRCEVEVLEYVKDPVEDQMQHHLYENDSLNRSSIFFVCCTCAAALAVTVVLPWFLMGSG